MHQHRAPEKRAPAAVAFAFAAASGAAPLGLLLLLLGRLKANLKVRCAGGAEGGLGEGWRGKGGREQIPARKGRRCRIASCLWLQLEGLACAI